MIRYLLLILLIFTFVFRVWNISSVPSGFSWDEMDNAYQAYSLLKTGRDLFANPLPVLLHSFADYKSSLYIYMTVPFVALGGMSIVTAKMAAILFGIISTLALGVISARLFKSLNWGIVTSIVMGLSPWWFSYSRLSFEAVGMLAFFLIAYALFPKKIWLSILMFAISVWTYSTAKLFAPIILFVLLINYWRSLGLKRVIFSLFFFGLLILPVQWQTLFGKGGTRFNELSVFTDPTTATEVNFQLEEGQISSGVTREVGLTPRLVDRLAHNKLTFWGSKLVNNYLQSFSSEFLFITGDPNLRHSPGKNTVGQLFATDAIFIIAGLVWLIKRRQPVVAVWLLLAPFASIITRDGGSHATRLLFMLPPLILLISAGMRQLIRFNKFTFFGALSLHIYLIFSFGYYYFSHYRFESLKPFQWGYEEVISKSLDIKDNYERVVYDFGNESAMMAYLVTTKYDPSKLQMLHPLPQSEIVPGYNATRFDDAYILSPGSRPWGDFVVPQSTLLILAAERKAPKDPMDTVLYPDGTNAFYFIQY